MSAFTLCEMNEEYPTMVGNIIGVKTPAAMANILAKHGINATYNEYCVRVIDFDYFKIEFDKGISQVFSDADEPEELIAQARTISEALTSEKVQYEFEIYDSSGNTLLAEYSYE